LTCPFYEPPGVSIGAAGAEFGLDDVEAGGLKLGGRGIESAISAKKFGVGDRGALRHHQEDVEMVGEDRVGVDVDAAEFGDLPELFAQNFAGRFVEEAFAVHDAGDAVIDGIAGLGRDLDSGFAHKAPRNAPRHNQQLTQPFSACPCYGPQWGSL
jgi:hypothetical protein